MNYKKILFLLFTLALASNNLHAIRCKGLVQFFNLCMSCSWKNWAQADLFYETKCNNLEGIKKAIKQGADINAGDELDNRTALHHIAADGFTNLVDFFIKNKANINVEDDYLQIPLHEAVINEHWQVAYKLIKNGASLDHRDTNGRSPYDYALIRSPLEAARLLRVRKGSD